MGWAPGTESDKHTTPPILSYWNCLAEAVVVDNIEVKAVKRMAGFRERNEGA